MKFPEILQSGHLVRPSHLIFSGVASLLACLLFFFLPGFPFGPGLCAVALVSGVYHLAAAGFVSRLNRGFLVFTNVLNVAFLGAAMHYSGGVLSPFAALIPLIFMSGAGYGIFPPFFMFISATTYAIVVGAEYFHILPPLDLSTLQIYASGWTTLFLIVCMTAYLWVTGSLYSDTIDSLRTQIVRDNETTQGILRKLQELEGPAQIGEMAVQVMHDFRNSLCAQENFLRQFMASQPLSESAKHDCAIMLEETRRASALTRAALKHVKHREDDFAPLDLTRLAQDLKTVISYHPLAKGAALSLSSNGPAMIRGNKEALQRMLFNIVKNGLESQVGRTDPSIAIEISAREGAVALSIGDRGCGIPKDILPDLGNKEVTTKPDGSGLGLLMASHIIKAHGARMEIESIEGLGTKVRLRFAMEGST